MDNMKHHKAGFTLIEVVIAVTLFGLLSMMVSPYFKMFMTVKNQAYIDKNTVINEKLAEGLLNWASQSKFGQLPAPYIATPQYKNALANPSDISTTAVLPYLLESGVASSEINDDGTTAQNVRVYQTVFNVPLQLPFSLAGNAGVPTLDIRYSLGVIYLTKCSRFDTCNTGVGVVIPGNSGLFDTSNKMNFSTSGSDLPATYVSTKDLQTKLLGKTRDNFEKIRDGFSQYIREKTLRSGASDNTNWYLNAVKVAGVYASPAVVVYAPNPTLELPTNHCWENWYSLSGNPGILKEIGMDPAEFSKNAWGGDIEFCPDYDLTTHDSTTDPAITGNPDTWRKRGSTPHFSALRMRLAPLACDNLGSCSSQNPDPVTSVNNFEFGL